MPSPDRSDLPKSPSGVRGLDAILRGGLPTGRTTLLLGGPGTGKTVFGLQFLASGMTRHGEPGLLISFEESPEELTENAASFPWFPADAAKRPVFIDGRPPEEAIETGTFDLKGLLAVIDAQVRRLGAKRIVLDGIDELFASHAPNGARQRELRRLLRWLDKAHLTTVVTLKPGGGTQSVVPPFEQVEYMAKAIVRLEYRAAARLVQRTLRVVKMRGSSFAAGEHAFLISTQGLDVAYTDVTKDVSRPSTERLSTGIERLDRMVDGGLRAGTVTLISGLPGTAKTTIGGSFLAAGLRQSRRALLVGFDEPAHQMIFDLESVGIRLAAYETQGLLREVTFNASAAIADEHYIAIERLVLEHEPELLVIDPISALEKAGGRAIADLVCERLVDLVKSHGITAIFSAVSSSSGPDPEMTDTQVSTVSDTWIHLSYLVQHGERNRTLTIVKSRGTGHSHQMRELLLTHEGVTLQDVYFSEGTVLLGTARLERELRDMAESEEREEAYNAELRELAGRKTRAEELLRTAERELAETGNRIEQFVRRTRERRRRELLQREARLESRGADPASEEESGIAG